MRIIRNFLNLTTPIYAELLVMVFSTICFLSDKRYASLPYFETSLTTKKRVLAHNPTRPYYDGHVALGKIRMMFEANPSKPTREDQLADAFQPHP
jgi:hypothetical protein